MLVLLGSLKLNSLKLVGFDYKLADLLSSLTCYLVIAQQSPPLKPKQTRYKATDPHINYGHNLQLAQTGI
jgi:hypothetical protein